MTKKRKQSKKNKFNYIKIFLILLCLVVIGTVGKEVFVRHFFNERMTVIPNIINLNEKDAIKYLKEAGLKYKIIQSKSEKVPLDAVFIQYPEAGKTVKVNRTIQIWVNSGEGEEVPNIVGLELLEARSLLQKQNIQIEKIDYQPSNEKYNTILGVYPKPGTKLEINQKITLLVSSQKVSDPSTMPNLIGLDLNDAKSILEQLGLSVSTTYAEDSTLPVNAIISTNPAQGSKINNGQKISLTVNRGVKRVKTEPSVEEIINQTNKELENKEIENIINETLNKIEQRGSNTNQNNNTQPQNNQPTESQQPKQQDNNSDEASKE